MKGALLPLFEWVGFALTAGTTVYSVLAMLVMRIRHRAPPATCAGSPPVTILKPLCGAESGTYWDLRSFCDQDYPQFQVVFGVADPGDPAVPIVQRLQREFPGRRLDLVVNRRLHGSSRKVSNLINLYPAAQHEFFVISDSDVRVGRDYLARVVAPLQEPDTGVVTCLYRGVPRVGLWSVLGAQFINEWFIPAVRVAELGGSRSFVSGSTMAIRREVLARIGGFAAIANQLADDHRLGQLTRDIGLRTVLSDVVVDTSVVERSLGELVRHELRWLRTIRTLSPWGYCLSIISFGVPVAALGVAMTGGGGAALRMLAVTALVRLMLHFSTQKPGASALPLAVLPARDLLSVALFLWSFVTRRVHWGDDHFDVDRDGSFLPVARPEASA
jgi:ceramide glucosyltransferase